MHYFFFILALLVLGADPSHASLKSLESAVTKALTPLKTKKAAQPRAATGVWTNPECSDKSSYKGIKADPPEVFLNIQDLDLPGLNETLMVRLERRKSLSHPKGYDLITLRGLSTLKAEYEFFSLPFGVRYIAKAGKVFRIWERDSDDLEHLAKMVEIVEDHLKTRYQAKKITAEKIDSELAGPPCEVSIPSGNNGLSDLKLYKLITNGIDGEFVTIPKTHLSFGKDKNQRNTRPRYIQQSIDGLHFEYFLDFDYQFTGEGTGYTCRGRDAKREWTPPFLRADVVYDPKKELASRLKKSEQIIA